MDSTPMLKLSKEHKDVVFSESKSVGDFTFNATVAGVFDDMVSRSVPYYEEMQRMTVELASDFAVPGTNLYDIGCSTATTLLAMDAVVDPTVNLIGIDNSQDMIAKAQEKVLQSNSTRNIKFLCTDIQRELEINNASVVTMLLTLQFVRPLYREKLMRKIAQGLNDGGSLLLIEKITSEETTFNRLFIAHYYAHKRRNGYSEMEIANKREALENVLIPYRVEENIELLKNAGFRHVDMFFRWYNFCGIIAMK